MPGAEIDGLAGEKPDEKKAVEIFQEVEDIYRSIERDTGTNMRSAIDFVKDSAWYYSKRKSQLYLMSRTSPKIWRIDPVCLHRGRKYIVAHHITKDVTISYVLLPSDEDGMGPTVRQLDDSDKAFREEERDSRD
jgi:hypothetical protein